MYVHICMQINILFANYSLPGDTHLSLFHRHFAVRPILPNRAFLTRRPTAPSLAWFVRRPLWEKRACT
jgi:hypothetical protein